MLEHFLAQPLAPKAGRRDHVLYDAKGPATICEGGDHPQLAGGCKLTLKAADGKVTITDENGTVANVTIADVIQSNGVIHVIDAVLTPKM